MKRTRLKQRSDRKILRDKIGKIHLEILKIERMNFDTCELCGKKTDKLGRFHIIPLSEAPKLEFVSENILLTGWFCCHNPWHHDYKKAKVIAKKLEEKLGADYELKLLITNKGMPTHTMNYLQIKFIGYGAYLKVLGGRHEL